MLFEINLSIWGWVWHVCVCVCVADVAPMRTAVGPAAVWEPSPSRDYGTSGELLMSTHGWVGFITGYCVCAWINKSTKVHYYLQKFGSNNSTQTFLNMSYIYMQTNIPILTWLRMTIQLLVTRNTLVWGPGIETIWQMRYLAKHSSNGGLYIRIRTDVSPTDDELTLQTTWRRYRAPRASIKGSLYSCWILIGSLLQCCFHVLYWVHCYCTVCIVHYVFSFRNHTMQ